MIEEKLYQAAQKSPELTMHFSQIEGKAREMKKRRVFISLKGPRRAVAMACVILLLATTVVAATTPVRYGAWIRSTEAFSDVNHVAGELGIVLPEKVGHSPFCSMSTMYTVPEGTTYLEAILRPAYTWYGIEYGNRELGQEAYALDVGNAGHQMTSYVFPLGYEDQDRKEKGVTYSYPSVEYAGLALQMDTELVTPKGQDNEFYIHRITWVDSKKGTAFRLSKIMYKDEDHASRMPQELVALAKAMVDMNRASNS